MGSHSFHWTDCTGAAVLHVHCTVHRLPIFRHSNNNNRGAFDHNKARFMKAAMQNLAHVISPMNLDNPALNKRLIEERRRAREERRKKIRKSRRNRR